MQYVQITGWIIGGIVAIFCPRLVLSLYGGSSLGGNWWLLFGPLAIFGLLIDLVFLCENDKTKKPDPELSELV